MAIVTSTPSDGDQVNVYDIPDDVLQQYAVSGEKAAQMFPEKSGATGIPSSAGAMAASRVANAEGLGEVQAYGDICICRQLLCNWHRCWWHYYYCYC
jgi:hypothetical protein